MEVNLFKLGDVGTEGRPQSGAVLGEVVDAKTGAPVIGVRLRLYDLLSGEVFSDVSDPTTNQFSISSSQYPDFQLGVEFSRNGYKTMKTSVAQLQGIDQVALMPVGPQLWLALAAIAALVYFAQARKKAVGSVSVADVMPFLLIGGGILAFSVVKKILESLGIWDSQATKDLDAAANNPNSFWSPTYWQTVNPSNTGWTYAINRTTADAWAAEIYNSFGVFNDCEECAIAVFKRCRTKANCSFLAYAFQAAYGEDLLTFLRGGWWPQDRLSDSDVAVINDYINRLPNY